MKKIITFFILITALSACSKKKPDVPEDVIPMKELQAILSDIHIAQAASSNAVLSDSSIYSNKEYVDYILKQHNIKREDFLKSMKFYTENPVLLEEVYDSVITQLSRMQAESEAGK
ncbi:MAG: DUF4296 domain-containing protein [Bacteroidota bacterium]